MAAMHDGITTRSIVKATLVGALLGSLGLVSSDLRADEKKNCLQAYDRAQTFRQDNKLMAAREQLKICLRDVCPAMVRSDCTTWLTEVDQSLPSVVIEARRPDGGDAVDVKVTLDGKPFATFLDGKAVSIDPGVHVFRFEMEGVPAIEEKMVIAQGSKNRKIAVVFKAESKGNDAPAVPTPAPDGTAAPQPSATTTEASISPLTYVFGGLGLAGIGAFTYLGLSFDSKLNDMDKCKPNCPQSDADSASSTRTLALISGGVGIVSLGVATYLFLSPSTADSSPKVGATSLDLLPTQGGALGTLRGSF